MVMVPNFLGRLTDLLTWQENISAHPTPPPIPPSPEQRVLV